MFIKIYYYNLLKLDVIITEFLIKSGTFLGEYKIQVQSMSQTFDSPSIQNLPIVLDLLNNVATSPNSLLTIA